MRFQHVLEARQFADPAFLKSLFAKADEMERRVKGQDTSFPLKGRVMASVFYEPSTRTRFSFETAMLRLGGQVVSDPAASYFSSAKKGETLEDTARMINGYADVMVLRHPEKGAAKRPGAVSRIPVLNGGDGAGEHPTQALLDAYTIFKELGRMENIKIAMVGDLKFGRTVHSLSQLLTAFKNVQFQFLSPGNLKMPEEYKTFLKEKGAKFSEGTSMSQLDPDTDIIYATRVQKERFEKEEDYNKVKDMFIIDSKVLKTLKKEARIMHPLPRVNEITTDVDSDPRAAYFRQAANGLYIRMALLEMLLKG